MIGGSALIALQLVERTVTRDVDVVALRTATGLESAKPLPPTLVEARDKVARDFEISEDWLNAGPGDLLQWASPMDSSIG